MKILKKIGFLVATGAMAVGVGVSFLAHGEMQTSAVSTLYSTADFTTKDTAHTGYADAWTYGTNWNVFGGQNNNGGWAYIKLGGKSATLATANPVYVNNISAMGEAISKVNVSLMVGTLPTNSGVTNYGVKVYSDAALTTQIDDSSLTSLVKPTAAISYDFAPSSTYQTANSTTVWPSGSYFKVYFQCTNTSTTNGIVWIDKISFYKDAPLVAVTSVTVDDPASTELTVGTSLTLTTTVLPEDATDKTVTWSSSNEGVAVIDTAGKIMPLANGSTRMTATSVADNTMSDYIDLTVSGQDLSTTAKSLTTTSLNLLVAYVNGYYGTGIVYSLRGVMAKAVGGEFQFGNNAAAGQGLLYNVSEYGAKITSIVITTGPDGAAAASTLYVGTAANPSVTSVTPTVVDTVATYDVAALGSFKFFAFGMTASSGTNYYDSIVVNLLQPADEAAAYATSFLSATDSCEANAAGVWAAQKTAFQALSSEAQAILVGATYVSSEYASNSDVQKCAQRYDLAVSRQSLENFMGRASISGVQFVNVTNNSITGSIIAIIIISIVSLSALSLVVLKKKSKHE